MRETRGARHVARDRGLVRDRASQIILAERGSSRAIRGEGVKVFGQVVIVTGRVLQRKDRQNGER